MSTPLPPSALPAHLRIPRLLVSATAVAAAAAYLLWLRLSGGSPSGRGTVVAALFIALDAALVALFWRASTSVVLAKGTRRALRLLGTAAAVALVGRTLALWLEP